MTAISYVASGSVNGASITVPASNVGDFVLVSVFRHNSNTAATEPTIASVAGSSLVNRIVGSGNNTSSLVNYCFYADGASRALTFTNATQIAYAIYRSSTGIVTYGGVQISSPATATTFAYSGTTGNRASGNTWTVGVGAGRSIGIDDEVPPTGMVNRTNTEGVSAGSLSIHDTNGDAAAWTSEIVTNTGDTSLVTKTQTIQLYELVIPSSGGGAVGRRINGGLIIPGGVF